MPYWTCSTYTIEIVTHHVDLYQSYTTAGEVLRSRPHTRKSYYTADLRSTHKQCVTTRLRSGCCVFWNTVISTLKVRKTGRTQNWIIEYCSGKLSLFSVIWNHILTFLNLSSFVRETIHVRSLSHWPRRTVKPRQWLWRGVNRSSCWVETQHALSSLQLQCTCALWIAIGNP